jgi:SAM-dependent methyltransferase
MYRLGTADIWWRVARDNPGFLSGRTDVLKPLGYAFAIEQIQRYRPHRILEIGHGGSGPILEMFAKTAECWGIDAADAEQTVTASDLATLREDAPGVTFVNGLVGASEGVLPGGYFDLACSVSVIEHIPEASIDGFFRDLYRILRPGGIHVHSFDVWWMRSTRYMFEAIERAGFEWLEPREQMTVFWEDWLRPYTREEVISGISCLVVERPEIVMEVFSQFIPRQQRGMHNWTTILMGVRKPSEPLPQS